MGQAGGIRFSSTGTSGNMDARRLQYKDNFLSHLMNVLSTDFQVTFTEEELPKGSGDFILGYYSNNMSSIVGVTEPFQVIATHCLFDVKTAKCSFLWCSHLHLYSFYFTFSTFTYTLFHLSSDPASHLRR